MFIYDCDSENKIIWLNHQKTYQLELDQLTSMGIKRAMLNKQKSHGIPFLRLKSFQI